MAKAREIPGLSAEDSYAAAAAKVVAVRAQELADHAAGVLDVGDIERVHDMRVASRRLRAALEVFEPCFPRKRLKDDLSEVKALADALGERRDRDVAIVALEALSAKMAAPDRAGIESLVTRLRAEQRGANEELARFVARDRLESLHERLRDLTAEARASSPEGVAAAPEGPRPQAREEPRAPARSEPARSEPPPKPHEPEPDPKAHEREPEPARSEEPRRAGPPGQQPAWSDGARADGAGA